MDEVAKYAELLDAAVIVYEAFGDLETFQRRQKGLWEEIREKQLQDGVRKLLDERPGMGPLHYFGDDREVP